MKRKSEMCKSQNIDDVSVGVATEPFGIGDYSAAVAAKPLERKKVVARPLLPYASPAITSKHRKVHRVGCPRLMRIAWMDLPTPV